MFSKKLNKKLNKNSKSSSKMSKDISYRISQFGILYIIFTNYWINAQNVQDDNGPLSEVQTAVGLDAVIPCDLTTTPNDKVQLIIWYKEGIMQPIYTFDARGKPLNKAEHWYSEELFQNKAEFFYDTHPPALRITSVVKRDAGLYKCRVDFHKTPTRNWRINLTVLVPPTHLTILDTYGAAVTKNVVGPYAEGAGINLTCLSSGGSPPPRVSWFREHALLNHSFQVLPDGTVRNILHLNKISRHDWNSIYTCQASNGHVVPPLSKTVKLDMELVPLFVRLQGLNHPLVAGAKTHVTCTSAGARPAPIIKWSKGGVPVMGATQSTSSDGNVTISELILIPEPEDNEKLVVCSVAGDLLDSRVLDVRHAPIVSLNLGGPLDSNNLKKGSDVYLECDIRANPPSKKVEWYHNNQQLYSSRGIIISNQTLAIQGISKLSHGQYFCRATNIQGSVSSNEVFLDVKYPPICKSPSTIIRAAIKQTINITCQVDANPMQNLTFKWQFNNTLENIIDLPIESSSMPFMLSSISASSFNSTPPHKRKSSQKYEFTVKSHRPTTSSSSLSSLVSSSSSLQLNDNDDDSNWLHSFYGIKSINNGGGYANDDDDDIDNDDDADNDNDNNDDDNNGSNSPHTSMVYSNTVYKNHFELSRKHAELVKNIATISNRNNNGVGAIAGISNNSNKRLRDRTQVASLSSLSTTTAMQQPPINNIYRYYIESYESFGGVSCIASNAMAESSQPCYYHIQPADFPDTVKNCTSFNATANSIQISCVPGYDGGIQQHYHVQVYDELNRQILYNTSYKYSEFTIKRLPSDSVFVIRVTSINLQGPSKQSFRLRARTLSAPLLRTASSTAVLVQLTPLLGALVGVMATLILVAVCIVIFIKFRTKHHTRPGVDTTTTETDKGSAEPLSRNMGSHSSLDDKNPDVVPQQENSDDEFHLEEKAFDRLNIDSQRIIYTPSNRLMHTTTTTATNANSSATSPTALSSSFAKQYGELSLTTNPSYAVYNTQQRPPAQQRPIYTAPPTLLSTRSPPNIYTRIPGRTYLPSYETRNISPTLLYPQSPTTAIATTNISAATAAASSSSSAASCTMPLLNSHNNHQMPTTIITQQSSLLLATGGGVLGNYDDNS